MSASRLNLTERRQLIELLKRMWRDAETIKLLQRMSNKSGVIYYETESSLAYDAQVLVTHEVGAVNRVIEVTTTFMAENQLWPFARSMPKAYEGSISEANEIEPTLFDDNLDVNLLSTPYQLRYIQRFSIDNPPSDVDVFVKCFIYGTDKGSFTVSAELL